MNVVSDDSFCVFMCVCVFVPSVEALHGLDFMSLVDPWVA